MSSGIYVHIPFCAKKCLYCDFNSTDKSPELKDSYTEALIGELENNMPKDADTVFIGGGTPPVLGIDRLVKVIEHLPKTDEFTVEVNPGAVDFDGFCKLKASGVNRISMGVQSANDNELKLLGRIHSFSDAKRSFFEARRAGFSNINIDLMFSIPEQTFDSFKHTLSEIVALRPEHISCYSLIVEENTPFYEMELNLPDEETDRKMYDFAVSFLVQNGYIQYEISNFAKSGFECRHNIKYWDREDYYGFGAGAHSLVDNVRYENPYNITDYINGKEKEYTYLSKKDEENEFIFLALRKTEGIFLEKYKKIFGEDFLTKYKPIVQKYINCGFLEVNSSFCRLTKDGISLSNTVMSDFMTL